MDCVISRGRGPNKNLSDWCLGAPVPACFLPSNPRCFRYANQSTSPAAICRVYRRTIFSRYPPNFDERRLKTSVGLVPGYRSHHARERVTGYPAHLTGESGRIRYGNGGWRNDRLLSWVPRRLTTRTEDGRSCWTRASLCRLRLAGIE